MAFDVKTGGGESTLQKQDEIISATAPAIVDQLDSADGHSGVLIPNSTTIPKQSSNAVAVVASLAAATVKLHVIDDIGEYMALYSAADRSVFVCFLPVAGGYVDVTIAAGTALFLGAVNDVDITTANTKLIIQFLG